MIINTGLRTDIVAFYSKWFINRIREGYVCVRNPYNPKLVTKYILDPKVVDCIEFCTKNPRPIIKYLDELKKYNLLFYVTITPYKKDIELNAPNKDKIIESFIKLREKLPNSFIGLRYDPIFLTKEYNIDYHINSFKYIIEKLKGYTDTCVISFLDMYNKVYKNASDLRVPNKLEQIEIVKEFVKITKENNIKLYLCCEDKSLEKYGVITTGCLSKEIISRSIPYKIEFPNINVRKECNCFLGNDIGSYNTCNHLCRYCYANYSKEEVLKNMLNHYDDSPLLVGKISSDDIIKEAKMVSYKVVKEQINFKL